MHTKLKLLLPSTTARAGWDVVRARTDVEAIPFESNMPTPAFHALLHDAHGVALGLTPFAEAELRAAPNLRVVARHGVGYEILLARLTPSTTATTTSTNATRPTPPITRSSVSQLYANRYPAVATAIDQTIAPVAL